MYGSGVTVNVGQRTRHRAVGQKGAGRPGTALIQVKIMVAWTRAGGEKGFHSGEVRSWSQQDGM